MATCGNGGPCARAATRKPTKRPRGLTLNSRAGIPKRLRSNCHQRSTLKPAWTASVRKGAGAQRPHCAKGRVPRTPASWRHLLLWVVAATAGPQWSDGWGSSTYVLALFVYGLHCWCWVALDFFEDHTDAVLGRVDDIRCCSTTGAWS